MFSSTMYFFMIKLFKVSMVCIQVGGMSTLQVELLILVLGNLFLRVYLLLVLLCPYIWVMAFALNFRKIFRLVLCLFQRLFLRFLPISFSCRQFFLGHFSWKFHFLIKLNDKDVIKLESFLLVINSIHLSSAPNSRPKLLIPWSFLL